MKFEIYHQLGHNHIWNLQSIEKDKTGDGIIISPRHMKLNKVEGLSGEIKNSAVFDPQYFCPSIQKGHLATYDFFPDVAANGFETSEYGESFADNCAKKCIKFQLNNNFRYIVIPTRHVEGMPTTFIENQQKLFVDPFLAEIRKLRIPEDKVLLGLILNDNMIKDREYSTDILNWITGIKGINGIYLITEAFRQTKQIKDIDYLFSLLNFVHILNQNERDVMLGYLNVEALLLSIANPKIITIGAYENTRIFNIRGFSTIEKKWQPGPSPRLYFSKLLQLIDCSYIGAIRRELPDDGIFDENEYNAQMFEPEFKWHFTKPVLYKHYFLEFSRQLNSISKFDGVDRYKAVCSIIQTARSFYSRLDEEGVVLDSNSDGSHLPAWLTAANQFAKLQGWR